MNADSVLILGRRGSSKSYTHDKIGNLVTMTVLKIPKIPMYQQPVSRSLGGLYALQLLGRKNSPTTAAICK
jgi:hypothetical protein